MRSTITLAFASFVVVASMAANSHAAFIQPTSISVVSSTINTPEVMINAATGNGGTGYVAPNPGSGGGGTSWYTSTAGGTEVTIDFDFASTTDIFEELYVWDYYTHSPSDWTLKLYSGVGGSGTELLDFDFTFIPGSSPLSTKHVIDFSDVAGVLSGELQTRNNSGSGGVGLAEFGFTTSPPPLIPEPSSLALAAVGFVALLKRRRRQA